MVRRARNTSSASNGSLNRKIDMLNNSINDLVDVLEKLSAKTQNNGGGGWNNNPFIRPGSRRRGSQRDMDRDFYYEWSQYYKAPKRNKSWRDMSDRERSEYNAEKNARKQEAQKYVRRSNEREELYRELRSSRFGSTSVGRYFQSVMERNQRIEDYGMMGKYMQANAGKIGKGLFGSGKAGAAATKAIGTFGKVISGASKILGGPFVTATLLAVDALQALGKGANQWKEATAEMYKHQTKQEQLQYELSKQQMLIENQMKIENVSAQGDIQMKMLETQGATMMEALKITTEQYAKSVDIALGPLTKGINETAYEAANARVDAVLQMQKLGLHKGQRELQYGRYREQRELQQSGKLASLEAERGVVETQYMIDSQRAAMEHTKLMESKHNLQMLVRDEHGNLLNYDAATGKLTTDNKVGGGNIAKGGQASRVITNTNEAGIGDIMNSNIVGANLQKFLRFQEGQQAKETAMGEYVWEKQREAADYQKTAVDAEYQLAQAQMDVAINVANKQLDIEVEKKEIVLEPLINGGASTSIYRSGTPVIGQICAMEKALQIAFDNFDKRREYVINLNENLRNSLLDYKDVKINTISKENPFIFNISVNGIKATEFKEKLEEYGVCVSIKSACTITITPSRIVMAMTHDRKRALSSWRISLSHLTTDEEIDEFLKIFDKCYKYFKEG